MRKVVVFFEDLDDLMDLTSLSYDELLDIGCKSCNWGFCSDTNFEIVYEDEETGLIFKDIKEDAPNYIRSIFESELYCYFKFKHKGMYYYVF